MWHTSRGKKDLKFNWTFFFLSSFSYLWCILHLQALLGTSNNKLYEIWKHWQKLIPNFQKWSMEKNTASQNTSLETISRIIWSNISWQNTIYTRCLSALSSWVLKVSSVVQSITSLSRLFWWLIVIIVKNCPHPFNPNLLRSNSYSWPLIFSMWSLEKRVSTFFVATLWVLEHCNKVL